jgi:hypothetical protein
VGPILRHFAPGTALLTEIRLDVVFLAACVSCKKLSLKTYHPEFRMRLSRHSDYTFSQLQPLIKV